MIYSVEAVILGSRTKTTEGPWVSATHFSLLYTLTHTRPRTHCISDTLQLNILQVTATGERTFPQTCTELGRRRSQGVWMSVCLTVYVSEGMGWGCWIVDYLSCSLCRKVRPKRCPARAAPFSKASWSGLATLLLFTFFFLFCFGSSCLIQGTEWANPQLELLGILPGEDRNTKHWWVSGRFDGCERKNRRGKRQRNTADTEQRTEKFKSGQINFK